MKRTAEHSDLKPGIENAFELHFCLTSNSFVRMNFPELQALQNFKTL